MAASKEDPSVFRANDRQVVAWIDERLTFFDEMEYLAPNFRMMKQLSTLVTAIAASVALQAQVTIGQQEMPHSGDHLFRTQAMLNPFLNYGATGPAHVWDFTSLNAAGQEGTEHVSVASTNMVYALVYADFFLNPNRANHANAGTDIAFSDMLPIENAYTFRHHSASAYKTVGYGAEVSNLPVPIIFDEHDVVYELPLNYGNTSLSHSSWKINLPTLAYYGYRQARQNEVDGWGSITTPSGTFDVLRVKTTIEASDTINIDTLGMGFTIDRPRTREYKWLAPGIRVPVMQVNTIELLGAEVPTAIYFYDQPRSITVEEPLAAMLCAGAVMNVPYTSTGVYNSGGFLVPSNVFRAQLSDANGDFSSPVNIGSVTATASGSITATIPANTLPGTGYRIRVVSTSPAFTGADNGFDLTLGTAPVATALAEGPTVFCAGEAVQLLAGDAPGASFQWLLDGDTIVGATAAALLADASGSYAVQVANACGSDLSAAIAVAVNPLPVHLADTASLLACNGEAVVLSTNNTSGQSVLGYQWALDGAAVAGADSADLAATQAGSYALTVTNLTTGCSFTTAGIELLAESVDSPLLTADGPTAFCAGGSVQLQADAPGASLAWTLDGNTIDGAEGPSLDADASGAYAAVAIGALGCASAPSAAVQVDVLPTPATPTIVATGSTVFCAGGTVVLVAEADAGLGVLWSTGSTEAVLAVDASGTYHVAAVDSNGCASLPSATLEVTVHALPEAPAITEENGLLSASGAGSFQWHFNGEPIAGADQATFAPVTSGLYTVTVTDDNGCSSTSADYAFIHTGVAETAASASARIAPNPGTGHFTLTAPGALAGERYGIYDSTGKLVQQGMLAGIRTAIDLEGRMPGLYFLRAEGPAGIGVLRIVLQ